MNLQGSLRVPFLSGPERTSTVAAATERDGMMRVEEGAWKGLVIILSRNATYRPHRGGCDTTHRHTHHKHTTTPSMCTHPGSSGTLCGPIYPSPGDFAPDGGVFSTHPPSTQNMIQGIPPPSSPVPLFFTPSPPLFSQSNRAPLFSYDRPRLLPFFLPHPPFFHDRVTAPAAPSQGSFIFS